MGRKGAGRRRWRFHAPSFAAGMGAVLLLAGAAIFGYVQYEAWLVLRPQRARPQPRPDARLPLALVRLPVPALAAPATAPPDTLIGYALPPADSLRGAWVVFLHDVPEHAASWAPRLRYGQLARLGLGVVCLSYRGFGASSGSAATITEARLDADAQAAYAWLRARGVPPGRIYIYGQGMGASLALRLAARQPCAGVAAESAIPGLAHWLRARYAWLPRGALWRLPLHAPADSLGRLPKLFLHARGDGRVPEEMARGVFARAPEPRLWVALEGGHGSAPAVSDSLYRATLRRFVRAAAAWNGLPPPC